MCGVEAHLSCDKEETHLPTTRRSPGGDYSTCGILHSFYPLAHGSGAHCMGQMQHSKKSRGDSEKSRGDFEKSRGEI